MEKTFKALNLLGRVKKGTGLWDGRRVRLMTETTYPNGRVSWDATLVRSGKRFGMGAMDRREFAPDEIEVIEE